MRITAWDPSRKINPVRSFEIEKSTRLISSTRIGKPVLMMNVKVSKDKKVSRWVYRDNLIDAR